MYKINKGKITKSKEKEWGTNCRLQAIRYTENEPLVRFYLVSLRWACLMVSYQFHLLIEAYNDYIRVLVKILPH